MIQASDLIPMRDRTFTGTIEAADVGPAIDEPILYLAGDKQVALDVHGLALLRTVFGSDSRKWIGKLVDVYRGEEPVIRIKIPAVSAGVNAV